MANWSAGQLPAPLNAAPGFKALEQAVGTASTQLASSVFLSDYRVDATGGRDSTVGIQQAINDASATGTPLVIPPGVYSIVPATAATDAAGATTVGLLLKSNLHIIAARGATFRLANNQSTDAAPTSLYLFFTSVALSNVSILGLGMDMNGANNPISPLRPATYDQTKNMGHIGVSGDGARIDDVVIEQCQFLNTPGTNCIVAGQSNTAGVTLGKRWTVAHNLFKNNGTDTSDHSAIFGSVDGMSVHDNLFWQDVPYGTVGKTGAQTAHEVHGANHTVHDNIIYNYNRGCYLGGNNTSASVNADIHDNEMVVTYGGVAVFRAGANAGAVRDARIHDNTITFNEQAYTGAPGAQIAFDCTPLLDVSNITFTNNQVSKTGANTIPAILALVQPTVAGVRFDTIRVTDNTGVGLTAGVQVRTNGTNGGLGFVEAARNAFVNFATVGAQLGIGIFVDATNTISTLVLDQNRFLDERGGSAAFPQGIVMQAGTITDLFLGPQTYKGLTGARYTETGGLTVTNRNGTTHVAGNYALSGWGTAPSVAVAARDLGGRVSVTCGTVPSANPTLTLTFTDHPWAVAPVLSYARGDLAAPTTGYWALTSLTASAVTWTFVGTPVAASGYVLDFAALGT